MAVKDSLGNQTTKTYDASHNVLTVLQPNAQTWSHSWDVRGNRLTTTDPLTHITTWTYDGGDRVLTVTDALSHVTTNTYDVGGKGDLLTVTDPNNNTTTYTYDGLSRVLTVQYLGYAQANVKYTYPTLAGTPLSVSAPFAAEWIASELAGEFAPCTRAEAELLGSMRFRVRQARRGPRHGARV